MRNSKRAADLPTNGQTTLEMLGNHPSMTVMSQRHRQRPGDVPYRDDPNAPPRFHSYTAGGLGPEHSFVEKNKSASLSSRCLGSFRTCCQICRPTHNTTASSFDADNNGVFYEDHFNDLSHSCSIGTSDDNGIWLNRSDLGGTLMSCMVWVLILYSSLTITQVVLASNLPIINSFLYSILSTLALATHAKTSLTDPGSVPAAAVPTAEQRRQFPKLSMCSRCQTYKPPRSHHCRICDRCISRMDHHCPWMNNCVGAGNLKHFTLFLVYTWLISVYALLLLGTNYFFCKDEECTFPIVLTQLARIMTLLSIGSFLFTSSMLMSVVYGVMTGIGTIDRLNKKANGTMEEADDESVQMQDIFGLGPYYTWMLPLDPVFPDYDKVMGYSTPQRLLREQMREGYESGSVVSRDDGSLVPV